MPASFLAQHITAKVSRAQHITARPLRTVPQTGICRLLLAQHITARASGASSSGPDEKECNREPYPRRGFLRAVPQTGIEMPAELLGATHHGQGFTGTTHHGPATEYRTPGGDLNAGLLPAQDITAEASGSLPSARQCKDKCPSWRPGGTVAACGAGLTSAELVQVSPWHSFGALAHTRLSITCGTSTRLCITCGGVDCQGRSFGLALWLRCPTAHVGT